MTNVHLDDDDDDDDVDIHIFANNSDRALNFVEFIGDSVVSTIFRVVDAASRPYICIVLYYGLPIVYGRPYCNDAKEGVGAITPPKLNRW